ncbi:MAG: MoxR family ATPase [Anaerolineae bacterium]|nr:MoxR family ATPase [Anaerolineae bacterium]
MPVLQDQIERESLFVNDLLAQINQVIVGQERLVDRVLTALLADGHVLLEGVPGLAKTLLIRTVAEAMHAQFARIQFTPDLLPADLIGTQVYNPQMGVFSIHRGPIFTNLLLADEINRAPAKVQSALLEAMQERQVTIASKTDKLPDLFMVMATQNPIEQEGTYPLPEAQVDRFMFKLMVDYPARTDERNMLDRMTGAEKPHARPVVEPITVLNARRTVKKVYVDERLKDYVLSLVVATRTPAEFGLADLKPLISIGASPRAGIYMIEAARAHAFLHGRGFVIPDDIKEVAPDVLRHRIITSYEAEAENITSDRLVSQVLEKIQVP